MATSRSSRSSAASTRVAITISSNAIPLRTPCAIRPGPSARLSAATPRWPACGYREGTRTSRSAPRHTPRGRPLACGDMDVAALRAHFPVLERLAYLNSGTDGPLPEPARAAAAAELAAEVRD